MSEENKEYNAFIKNFDALYNELESMNEEEAIDLLGDNPEQIGWFVEAAIKEEKWKCIAFMLRKQPTWREVIFNNIGDDDLETLKYEVQDLFLSSFYDKICEIYEISFSINDEIAIKKMIEGEINKRAAELDFILNFNEPSETIDIKLMQEADQEMLEFLDEHPEIDVAQDSTIPEGMSKEEFGEINSEMENFSFSFVDIDTCIEEGLSADEILSKLEYESGIHLSNEEYSKFIEKVERIRKERELESLQKEDKELDETLSKAQQLEQIQENGSKSVEE